MNSVAFSAAQFSCLLLFEVVLRAILVNVTLIVQKVKFLTLLPLVDLGHLGTLGHLERQELPDTVALKAWPDSRGTFEMRFSLFPFNNITLLSI